MANENGPKPGYKSTEFWLTMIAQIVGGALASGAIEEASPLARICGMGMMVLSGLGYTFVRGGVKKAAKVLIFCLVLPVLLAGCCVGHVRAKGILGVTTEVSERHDRLLNDEATEDDKDPEQTASHLRSSKLLRLAVTKAAESGDD